MLKLKVIESIPISINIATSKVKVILITRPKIYLIIIKIQFKAKYTFLLIIFTIPNIPAVSTTEILSKTNTFYIFLKLSPIALITFISAKFSLTAELNIIKIKKNPKNIIINPINPINPFKANNPD